MIATADITKVDLALDEEIAGVTTSDFIANRPELKTAGSEIIQLEVVNGGIKEYQLFQRRKKV